MSKPEDSSLPSFTSDLNNPFQPLSSADLSSAASSTAPPSVTGAPLSSTSLTAPPALPNVLASSPTKTLRDLEREQAIIRPLKTAVPTVWLLMQTHIRHLRAENEQNGHIGSTVTSAHSSPAMDSNYSGELRRTVSSSSNRYTSRATRRKRVRIDVDTGKAPPFYNYVGRMLGPRGNTLQNLEEETNCKVMIRGKGSIRKDKEHEVSGKPGWDHIFTEPLHIVIEVSDNMSEEKQLQCLKEAQERVEELLIPIPDEQDTLKRQQLRDLAILNGTYRPHHHPHRGPDNGRNGRGDSRTQSYASYATEDSSDLANSVHATRSFHRSNSMQPRRNRGRMNHRSSQSHRVPNGSPAFLFVDATPTSRSSAGAASNLSNNFGRMNLSSPVQRRASPLPNGFVDARRSPRARPPPVPALNLEGLNGPAAENESVSGFNPVQAPLSSPTIVDPSLYPFPSTPVPATPQESGFGSPIWSPPPPGLPRSNSAFAGSTSRSNANSFTRAEGPSMTEGRHFSRSASFGVPGRSSASQASSAPRRQGSLHRGTGSFQPIGFGSGSFTLGAGFTQDTAAGPNLSTKETREENETNEVFDRLFSNAGSTPRRTKSFHNTLN